MWELSFLLSTLLFSPPLLGLLGPLLDNFLLPDTHRVYCYPFGDQ